MRTLPLTWAQQSWMQVQALNEQDAWRHDNHAFIQVPRQVSVPELSAAILELARNHPPLRARLRRTGSGFGQDIFAPDSPAEHLENRLTPSALVVPPGTSLAEATERVRAEYVATCALNLVATLQLSADRATTSIGILLAHAFVDGWGAHALSRILRQHLDGGREIAPQTTLYDVLRFESSESGRQCSRRNIAELIKTATLAAELGALPERPVGRSRDRVDLTSIEYSTGWLPRALTALGGTSRVLRAAGLLALVFLAYCSWTGQRRSAAFQTPVSNRFTDSEQDFVGMLMMRTWILAEWKPDETYRQLVRRLASRLVAGLSHGRVEPARATDELARHGFSCPPQLYFNYFEPDDISAHRLAEPRQAEIPWSQESARRTSGASGGVPFEYNAYVYADRAFSVTKFDEDVFAGADVGEFARHLKRLAVALLDEPGLSAGRACDHVQA